MDDHDNNVLIDSNLYKMVQKQLRLEDLRYARYHLKGCYYRPVPWYEEQELSFLDQLLRVENTPPIVLRELIYPNHTKFELFDGWQRIKTIKDFFDCILQLPTSLSNVPKWEQHVPNVVGEGEDAITDCLGGRYEMLPTELKDFINNITITANIFTGITDEDNPTHQQIAKTLFNRFQPDML